LHNLRFHNITRYVVTNYSSEISTTIYRSITHISIIPYFHIDFHMMPMIWKYSSIESEDILASLEQLWYLDVVPSNFNKSLPIGGLSIGNMNIWYNNKEIKVFKILCASKWRVNCTPSKKILLWRQFQNCSFGFNHYHGL